MVRGAHVEDAKGAQLSGFSGQSFVIGFEHPRTSITWTLVRVPTNGKHVLDVRYSNYMGQDGELKTRTMTVVVNGKDRQIQLPITQSWRAWSDIAVIDVELVAGDNTIEVRFSEGDTGHCNIDFIEVF